MAWSRVSADKEAILGVQIAEDQISNAIDVVLLLLAGIFRATVKNEVVDCNKLPQ